MEKGRRRFILLTAGIALAAATVVAVGVASQEVRAPHKVVAEHILDESKQAPTYSEAC